MAKIGSAKKILSESFEAEDQQMAQILGGILNPILESIVQAMNKRLNVADNLDQEIVRIGVRVNNGNIIDGLQVRTSLPQVVGAVVINVTGRQGVLPSGVVQAQGISKAGNILNIQQLTGLEDDGQFTVTLLLIGS